MIYAFKVVIFHGKLLVFQKERYDLSTENLPELKRDFQIDSQLFYLWVPWILWLSKTVSHKNIPMMTPWNLIIISPPICSMVLVYLHNNYLHDWVSLFGQMLINIPAPWFAYGPWYPNYCIVSQLLVIHSHEIDWEIPYRMAPPVMFVGL